jgi:hypothetical protein
LKFLCPYVELLAYTFPGSLFFLETLLQGLLLFNYRPSDVCDFISGVGKFTAQALDPVIKGITLPS